LLSTHLGLFKWRFVVALNCITKDEVLFDKIKREDVDWEAKEIEELEDGRKRRGS